MLPLIHESSTTLAETDGGVQPPPPPPTVGGGKSGVPVGRDGELGVLRVREHPLSAQVYPLTVKARYQNEEKLWKIPFGTKIEQKIWLFKAGFG